MAILVAASITGHHPYIAVLAAYLLCDPIALLRLLRLLLLLLLLMMMMMITYCAAG